MGGDGVYVGITTLRADFLNCQTGLLCIWNKLVCVTHTYTLNRVSYTLFNSLPPKAHTHLNIYLKEFSILVLTTSRIYLTLNQNTDVKSKIARSPSYRMSNLTEKWLKC